MKLATLLLLPCLCVLATDRSSWWDGFEDPTLKAVVEAALDRSFSVRLAQVRIAEKKASLRSARSARLPVLDLRGQNARVRGIIPSAGGSAPGAFIGPNERGLVQKSVEARFDLDLWKTRKLAADAASAESLAAGLRAQAAAVAAAQSAARHYIDFCAIQLRRKLVSEELALLGDLLVVTQARLKAGLANQAAEAATQAEIAQAETRLRSLEEEADVLLARLAQDTGRQPGEWSELRARAISVPIHKTPVPGALPAEKLTERPDVEESRQLLAAAIALRNEAKRSRLPQLQLIGNVGRLADSFPALLLGSSNLFSFGNSLLLPLFDGGRIRANFELRSAQEKQAAIRLEESIVRAATELSLAEANYLAATAKQASLERFLAASRQEAEIAAQQFNAGIGEWSEVLERKRSTFARQEELLLNRAAQSRAQIDLYAALAGGW